MKKNIHGIKRQDNVPLGESSFSGTYLWTYLEDHPFFAQMPQSGGKHESIDGAYCSRTRNQRAQ